MEGTRKQTHDKKSERVVVETNEGDVPEAVKKGDFDEGDKGDAESSFEPWRRRGLAGISSLEAPSSLTNTQRTWLPSLTTIGDPLVENDDADDDDKVQGCCWPSSCDAK